VAIGLLCIYRSDLFLKSHNISLVAVIFGFVRSNLLTALIDFVAVNHNSLFQLRNLLLIFINLLDKLVDRLVALLDFLLKFFKSFH